MPAEYLNDFRFQTRPGTPIDKAQRKTAGYLFDNYSGSKGKPSGLREVERHLNRLPDDGHGRVLVAHYENAIPNPYYLR